MREFAELTQIPLTMTVMGLGAFPGTHPLCMGMLGMHGTYSANMAMHEADLLIAVGARFDDRVTGKLSEFSPRARVIHIDIDPTSIKKNVHAHIPIVGDVKTVLRELGAGAEFHGRQSRQRQGAAEPVAEAGERVVRPAPAGLPAGGQEGDPSRSTSSRRPTS